MEMPVEHVFRRLRNLCEVFNNHYFAKSHFDIAIKVASNHNYYKSLVGHDNGFYEHEMDLLRSFRENMTTKPDAIGNDWGLGETDFLKCEEFREYYKSNPDKAEELFKECMNSLEIYEVALNTFIKERNLIEPEKEEIQMSALTLKSQKEQIRLLHDLGILDYLTDKYPNTLGKSKNQLATLVGQILKLERASIQPTINALYSKDYSKNHPSETPKTKAIIANLNANESN